MEPTKFYLLETEYVGNNDQSPSRTLTIQTQPGEHQFGHRPRLYGWLGIRNDFATTAHGEYDTLPDARLMAKKMGFTVPLDLFRLPGDEDILIEAWGHPDTSPKNLYFEMGI